MRRACLWTFCKRMWLVTLQPSKSQQLLLTAVLQVCCFTPCRRPAASSRVSDTLAIFIKPRSRHAWLSAKQIAHIYHVYYLCAGIVFKYPRQQRRWRKNRWTMTFRWETRALLMSSWTWKVWNKQRHRATRYQRKNAWRLERRTFKTKKSYFYAFLKFFKKLIEVIPIFMHIGLHK